jgi:hypothetical protein
MERIIKVLFILSLLFLTGCSLGESAGSTAPDLAATDSSQDDLVLLTLPVHQATETFQPISVSPTPIPPASETATKTQKAPSPLAPTNTDEPTLGPDSWKLQPVVSTISDRVIQIYQRGLELGNNPRAFSKIGDCGTTPTWFLGDFDRGPEYYRLGDYQELAAVIDEFKGSFDRTSLAARSGFNTSALFTPLWSDLDYCEADEAPLACEYRIHKPILAFVMLGSNDVWQPDEFETQMRKLIEYSIQNGVIPILSTKADNQEKDHSINITIVRLALEYELPLVNFWRAVDPLSNHGLQSDLVHLTYGANFFDEPDSMEQAWPVRNLTALQILDAVWKKVTNQEQ